MKLFGYNLTLSKAIPAPPVQKSGEFDLEDWLKGEEVAEGPVLHNAYSQVVWVYRAINVLAEQVANVPFRFSLDEREGESLITSGPLVEFYARPHPQINRFQYWELRVIWLMLRGECVRVPIWEEAPGGRRLRVLMLDPARFQHIVEDHELLGWRYTGFGRETPLAAQVFLPEEIWFEKLPNPFDFWRGLPPLQVADTAAKADFAAGSFMKGLIENNADNGLIVRTPQPMDPKQREQMLAALRQRKRRAGLADRPLLLWSGAEVVQPKLSSSDLQFLENRKFSRAEICAAFGVPEEIVTTTDTAKYDVMEGARLNFIDNRVAPLCRRLEAEEEVTVRAIEPRAVGWFDLDTLPILQQARRNRLATARTGFEMGIPFNELNRVFDLGFKALPWGNTGYVAVSLREIGEEAEGATRDGAPGFSRLSALEETTPYGLGNTQSRLEGGAPESAPLTPLQRAVAWFDTLMFPPASPQRQAIRTRLKRFLFEQRCRALARIAETGGLDELDAAAEGQKLVDALRPVLEETLMGLVNALADTPTPLPAEAAAECCRWQEHELRALSERVFSELKTTVAEGRDARERREQLSARIRAVYNTAGDAEAERFAQSATGNLTEAAKGLLRGLTTKSVTTKSTESAKA